MGDAAASVALAVPAQKLLEYCYEYSEQGIGLLQKQVQMLLKGRELMMALYQEAEAQWEEYLFWH